LRNLTEAAQQRNIEIGLPIRAPDMVYAFRDAFPRLIRWRPRDTSSAVIKEARCNMHLIKPLFTGSATTQRDHEV